MPRARRTQVSLEATPYYHCIARCVRRAFLCGVDAFSGRSFEHRKLWVVDRLATLTEVFAIDVCAYAVMSNHYHVVLRIDAERARGWSDIEVMARWQRLFGLPLLASRYQLGVSMTKAELDAVAEQIEAWRARLMDLSWFMRCLNEHLARKANAEDGCTGRFWEGRFKSQALLDEAAILTCMSYVDLNPIRAGLAQTPEASDFTSIQARIRAYGQSDQSDAAVEPERPAGAGVLALLAFGGDARSDSPQRAIPFAFEDYLQLVDWAGRAVREGKRGHIPQHLPPVLVRLGIEPDRYLQSLEKRAQGFGGAIGRAEKLRSVAAQFGRRFFRGQGQALRLFPVPG